MAHEAAQKDSIAALVGLNVSLQLTNVELDAPDVDVDGWK